MSGLCRAASTVLKAAVAIDKRRRAAMNLMKKAMTALATMMTLVIGAGTATAIVLRNEDTENHEVTITSPTMTKQYEFRARTLSFIVCVGECEFTVAGIGTVRAKSDDIVSIRDGKVITIPAGTEPE